MASSSRLGRAPKVLDLFPDFEEFWARVRADPISSQLDRWEREHMAPWPELLSKQKENYAEEGFDWRRVARKWVFPFLEERFPRMRAIHLDLVRNLPKAWRRTRSALGIRFPVRFVIYVGIGCGAGWATTYEGRPSCLFGLENAATEHDGKDGWTFRTVAHEVAHLAHQHWRGERWEHRPDPWWMLYEEGFATHCERRIEPEGFLRRTGRKDWLPWCDEHRSWLARKFLSDVAGRRSLRPFFGSWYNIRGQIETGYYLGSEMIREWTERGSLQEVARLPLPEVRLRARATLGRLASRSS
ncbi:MAG: hypothetical protein KGI98_15130 [Euryarchaeota archaeon]|nr:hypothetical protein [Euryarchaeota archaeon]